MSGGHASVPVREERVIAGLRFRTRGHAAPDGAPRAPKAADSMLRGASVLVAGRYAVAALQWTASVVIIRELAPRDFGRYTLIFSVVGIIGLISDLRLSRIVLSSVLESDQEADQVVGSYVTLRLAIGLVSYLVAMAVVLAVYRSEPEVIVGTAVAGVNLVILSGANGLTLLFEARYWLRSVASAQLLGAAAQFAITVAIALGGLASVLWFAWATVVNAVVFAFWLVWVVRHVARFRLRVDRAWWWAWAKESAPLALGAALDTVYFRIDIVMLSLLATTTAVGAYGVDYKFSDLLGAVPLAVVTPAITMMVSAWPDDLERFRRTFRHACVLLAVVAVGASAGFGVFAEQLIRLLYGSRYTVTSDAARLLVAGQALHFFTSLCFVTLMAASRNRLYPIAMLVGVVVNVGLNVVLIPRFSYNGAGWATVITETAVLVVLGTGVARLPGIRPLPWGPITRCLVAGAVTGGVGWALLQTVMPWALAGALSAVVYLGVLHLVGVDGSGGLRVLATEGHI